MTLETLSLRCPPLYIRTRERCNLAVETAQEIADRIIAEEDVSEVEREYYCTLVVLVNEYHVRTTAAFVLFDPLGVRSASPTALCGVAPRPRPPQIV